MTKKIKAEFDKKFTPETRRKFWSMAVTMIEAMLAVKAEGR